MTYSPYTAGLHAICLLIASCWVNVIIVDAQELARAVINSSSSVERSICSITMAWCQHALVLEAEQLLRAWPDDRWTGDGKNSGGGDTDGQQTTVAPFIEFN